MQSKRENQGQRRSSGLKCLRVTHIRRQVLPTELCILESVLGYWAALGQDSFKVSLLSLSRALVFCDLGSFLLISGFSKALSCPVLHTPSDTRGGAANGVLEDCSLEKY